MLSFVVVVAAVVLDVAGDRTGGQPEASTMASTSEMRIRNGSPSGAAAITRLSFVIWLLFFCVRVFVCLCVCVCVCTFVVFSSSDEGCYRIRPGNSSQQRWPWNEEGGFFSLVPSVL